MNYNSLFIKLGKHKIFTGHEHDTLLKLHVEFSNFLNICIQ